MPSHFAGIYLELQSSSFSTLCRYFFFRLIPCSRLQQPGDDFSCKFRRIIVEEPYSELLISRGPDGLKCTTEKNRAWMDHGGGWGGHETEKGNSLIIRTTDPEKAVESRVVKVARKFNEHSLFRHSSRGFSNIDTGTLAEVLRLALVG